jgi:3-methyladenine DNA glycosylase AlkC
VLKELIALHTSGATVEQLQFAENALLLLIAGIRQALPTEELLPILQTDESFPGRNYVKNNLELVDTLLDSIVSQTEEDGGDLFSWLEEVARDSNWEIRRRLSEALPQLLKADLNRSITLMAMLREDPPHTEWRADIRRRVVEATPVLYKLDKDAAHEMLKFREGDEIYVGLAILETLEDIGDTPLKESTRFELVSAVSPQDKEYIRLYALILHEIRTDPESALRTININRGKDRMTKICLSRSLERLLPVRPRETLRIMTDLFTRRRGEPIEHQNVRRPISKALPVLIPMIDDRNVGREVRLLIERLAQDGDIHIRRALSDHLPRLATEHPNLVMRLIEEHLLRDHDEFVRRRTWSTLMRLAEAHPEQARNTALKLLQVA